MSQLFTHKSNLCFKHAVKKAIQTNGVKIFKSTLSLRACGPLSNTPIPPPTPLTTPNDSSIDSCTSRQLCNKSPMVTMGHLKFTPKTATSPSMITTPSYTPIPRLTSLTIPNGIRIQLAVLPQYTFRTDRHRHTDRPTDRIDDSSITWVLTLFW